VLDPHQRALSLIGVPFRAQGRDPAIGLDCLGVVVWSYQLRVPDVPRYKLDDGTWDQVLHELSPWFEPVANCNAQSGDLAAFRLSRSFHFGVISDSKLVHADLAVGRVVARRLPLRLGRECRIFRHRGDD
jgi:cell wall-associated NlpC family hydrolase